MDDLFGKNTKKRVCEDVSYILADRIRPQVLSEIIGQEHLLGDGKPLRKMVESDEISSLILWGPPGSGKTTLAKVIANVTSMDFLSFSAVLSSIKEIKKVMANSERNLYLYGNRSILFIDEIHRFNKAQQDAFLSFIERGTIILIGATTENPSFEIISPLLSRIQIFILNPLEPEHIEAILIRALTDQDKGLGLDKEMITPTAIEMISNICSGDARYALNLLELAVKLSDKVTVDSIKEILNRERVIYDKSGEEHYNLISALHKSIRDSDPQGAIYWIARMLEGGEDPKYIIRRLIRMSMEDVGLADPNALLIATAAQNAYIFIGSPEGDIALAEVAVYLAYAPKSNSLDKALNNARRDAKEYGSLPVPLHLRNAPTRLMKEIGYAKDYKYAHNYDDHIVNQQHLPDKLKDKIYYKPTEMGFEDKVKKRFEEICRKLQDREQS